MQPTQAQNFLKTLRENWFFIVFIGGVLIGWNNYSNRLNTVESAQAEQKISQKGLADQVALLNNAIIEIKANYLFIKDTLGEIKQKQ